MSLYELAERHRIHSNIKLFLQEEYQKFTLDKIVYKNAEFSLAFNKVNYKNAFFIIKHKYYDVKLTINYSDVIKYFEFRSKFLEARKIFLRSHKNIMSDEVFKFRLFGTWTYISDKCISAIVTKINK